MLQIKCPYLGLKEDANTALDFPSQGNYCHHSRPIAPVNTDHQEQFCLTGDHTQCPVYKSIMPVPLPAAILGTVEEESTPRKNAVLYGIPVIIAGIAALAFAWNVLGARIGAQSPIIPGTGAGSPGSSSWAWLPESEQRLQQNTSTPTDLPAVANCLRQDGWAPYIVAPTDSLYRLSVLYRVSVDELQKANCMDEKTVILPGQVIYLPVLPTPTPSATPTQVIYYPPIANDSSGSSSSKSTSTEVPILTQPTPKPPEVTKPKEPTADHPEKPRKPKKPTKPPKKED